jgi:hypothetical protein
MRDYIGWLFIGLGLVMAAFAVTTPGFAEDSSITPQLKAVGFCCTRKSGADMHWEYTRPRERCGKVQKWNEEEALGESRELLSD